MWLIQAGLNQIIFNSTSTIFENWLKNVSSTGTFYVTNISDIENIERGPNTIPSDWTLSTLPDNN
jgi:hypothetical protein